MRTDITCYRHPGQPAGVACQRCERPICPQCMRSASVGFHCPECTKASGQRVYTARSLAVRPIVTQVLIGINVAVFVAMVVQGNGFGRLGGSIFQNGALYGPLVDDGEWWRLVTGGFLHAGFFHVAFNMALLFQLGTLLEKDLGRLRYGLLYLTSLLGGSLGVMILDPRSVTVGASGAVFGLMGALFVVARARRLGPIVQSIGGLIVINLLITFVVPNISIGGHLGGLATGAAVGAFYEFVAPQIKVRYVPEALCALLAVVLFFGGIVASANWQS